MSAVAASVAVIGAGSWGTALAMQLARLGARVSLWGRNRPELERMRTERVNARYLPGIPFPESLCAELDLDGALQTADWVLLAPPSVGFADTLQAVAPRLPATCAGVAWATKGFEPGSGRFLHEVAGEILGDRFPLALITGPSFAKEVAQMKPTALTVASTDAAFAERVAKSLHGIAMRAYHTDDLPGAELGGALKNVLAVATGIADGLELGANARAAIITRGLAEMMRLSRAIGGDPETLTGLAGMGDLVLTCTGDLSRNRRLGLALGRGESIEAAVAAIGQVVESIQTSDEVMRLADRHGVELPIAEQMYLILHRGATPKDALKALLGREQKAERA
jgi:glycerol-3-phosphate dehydrogenase (NAD(P)+)